MGMGKRGRGVRTSWDSVADWYDGWVGAAGSEHHRKLAVPAVMELLAPRPGERVLDLGCGQGVLARPVLASGAEYTGVDVSARLLAIARRRHGGTTRFVQGDACRLREVSELAPGSFDAAVFLLSIQDMDPLADALSGAAWALRRGGRAVFLMTHPCFRVPRQSGWGWDAGRKLQYRRVDRYLTPLLVPNRVRLPDREATTFSFHRPLEEYVNGLAACGLAVDRVREIASCIGNSRAGPKSPASADGDREIPLFIGIRARRLLPDR